MPIALRSLFIKKKRLKIKYLMEHANYALHRLLDLDTLTYLKDSFSLHYHNTHYRE
jgi:hypothetical protein